MSSLPIQPHPLPDNLVYTLPSIVEPLDLSSLFSTPQPVEIELGSGDGSFLLRYAGRHPERNFIGVERLLGRIRKLDRKGRRLGLVNLRGIRIESLYFLKYLLPPHCAHAIHIYFPDPWPKKKHHKNRIINGQFPSLVHRILQPEGLVHLRTDDEDYFQQMRDVFSAETSFLEVEPCPELIEVQTDFERDFAERGIQVQRVSYQRQS